MTHECTAVVRLRDRCSVTEGDQAGPLSQNFSIHLPALLKNRWVQIHEHRSVQSGLTGLASLTTSTHTNPVTIETTASFSAFYLYN